MNEERKMILQMLQDGAITVEEAERLIEAVPGESDLPGDTAMTTTASVLAPRRIYILVEEGGRPKVNIRIPFSLVRAGLKLGKTFGAMSMKNSSEDAAEAIEMLKNIDIDELLDSINDGEIMLPYIMVDVENEEKGERVKIILE